MTEQELAFCQNWCASHAKTWQVLNRSQWKFQLHPKALVRYVDEVRQNEDEIKLILEYLASPSCIASLSLYNQGVEGSWTPIRAWLEVSNKSVQGVRSVRLYHGLQWVVATTDNNWYLIDDGCAEKVSVKYYWNCTTVADVTGMSSSGVSVRIIGLQRDPETGLFSYALEKHERKQQDVPEYLFATTVYEDAKREQHTGVKQASLDTTGQQASVGDGKIVRRTISKNADCTSNVENAVTQEKAVAGASEQTAVGLTSKTVTTTNRNQAEPADATELGIGESVENVKTEGGLWNQVIRRVTRYARHLSDRCRKTVFAHVDATEDVTTTNPGFVHVEEAANGVIREKSVSRTADGSYKIDASVTTEKPVADASETIAVGLTGTTRTVVKRNQADKAAAPTEIGASVENSKTDGGLWNQSIRTLVKRTRTWLGETCRNTLFAHHHGKRHVQSADPGFTHVAEASGGVVLEKSVSRTADGAYEISEQETREKGVQDASVTKRMTLAGLVVRREHKSQSEPLPEPTQIGDSVTNTKTPGGLYDTTQEQAGRVGAGLIGEAHSENKFNAHHEETRNLSADAAAGIAVRDAVLQDDGTILSVSKQKRENGTSDVKTTTVKPKSGQEIRYWSDCYGRYTLFRYWNKTQPIIHAITSGTNIRVTNEFRINEHGLYDGSWKETFLFGTSGESGSRKVRSSEVKKSKVILATRRIGGMQKQLVQDVKVTKKIVTSTYSDWEDQALDDITQFTIPDGVDPVEYAAFEGRILGKGKWVYYIIKVGEKKWVNVTA